MTNMALFAEQQVRADLARLLLAAVEASGRARCDIARDAQIHKDALRRVLAGERSASLGEALRILAASGVAPPPAWRALKDEPDSGLKIACGARGERGDPPQRPARRASATMRSPTASGVRIALP